MIHLPATLLVCLLVPGLPPIAGQEPPQPAPTPAPAQDPEDSAGEEEVSPPAVVSAPQQDPITPKERRRWGTLRRREKQVGFNDGTLDAALAALKSPRTLGLTRGCALLALGTIRSVASRPALELAAVEAAGVERSAAILALGEMGPALNGGMQILTQLLSDPDEVVVECALLALGRCGDDRATRYLKTIAASKDHPQAERARAVQEFIRAPNRPCTSSAAQLLLTLRFEAAKRFGTVDGRSWSLTLLETLQNDEAFLDEIVLATASKLTFPGIKDHLLEVLTQPGRPVRLSAAVRAMPEELEILIASGLWRPDGGREWAAVVDAAVETGVAASMPETMRMAVDVPSVAPTAAALLLEEEPRLDEFLRTAFTASDPRLRIRAARAVGNGGLIGYLQLLRALDQDGSFEVRAAGWVARLRLGDSGARDQLQAVLADRMGAYDGEERRTVLDALERTGRSEAVVAFLLDLVPETEGLMQTEIQALLSMTGYPIPGERLREALLEVDGGTSSSRRLLRGLGHLPSAEDLHFLAQQFPVDGDTEGNLELAQILIENGHAKVEPLLRAAIWRGPWHRSVLAAAVIKDSRGMRLLMHWVAKPPREASSLDIRRLGFAIGEWGGLESIEELRALLGGVAGADRPALQGALLGALTTRTH